MVDHEGHDESTCQGLIVPSGLPPIFFFVIFKEEPQ